MEEKRDRLQLADSRSSSDSTERPLHSVQLTSKRDGPVWIVERPLSATDRLTVDDPCRSSNLL